jgi:hypothetical protein
MGEQQLNEDYKTCYFKSSTYNVLPCYDETTDLKAIAQYTRNNFDNIDLQEYQRILCQISKKENVLVEIKRSEFLYYEPQEKITSINVLIEQLQKEFDIYQGLIQGYTIEDTHWLVADHNNKRFNIKSGQFVMYNSVTERNVTDKYLLWFLSNMVDHIKKFMDPCLKYKVKQKFVKGSDEMIVWILYVFTPIN